jgi:hypothetical protein
LAAASFHREDAKIAREGLSFWAVFRHLPQGRGARLRTLLGGSLYGPLFDAWVIRGGLGGDEWDGASLVDTTERVSPGLQTRRSVSLQGE